MMKPPKGCRANVKVERMIAGFSSPTYKPCGKRPLVAKGLCKDCLAEYKRWKAWRDWR